MAVDAICKLALPEGTNDFNHDYFRGKDTVGDKVVSACETLTLFGGRRLVIVKDLQQIPAAQLAPVTEYLLDPSPVTVLVLHGRALGRGVTKRSALYKRATKSGVAQEFKPLREWEVGTFVRKRAQMRGLTLDRDAEATLIRSVGTDLLSLDTALEKVDLYLGTEGPRHVHDGVLAEVVAVTRTHQIWDLTGAVGRRDLGESLTLMSAMMDQGQSAVGINLMVGRHFRQLWQVKCCMDRSMDNREIASAVGIQPWMVDKSAGAARAFNHEQLQRILSVVYETERKLKSSRLKDRVLIERMVLDVCTSA
jgi:DNA polymerase-3 subunit delta